MVLPHSALLKASTATLRKETQLWDRPSPLVPSPINQLLPSSTTPPYVVRVSRVVVQPEGRRKTVPKHQDNLLVCTSCSWTQLVQGLLL